MPVHDWTRVAAGIYHEFHGRWIYAIREALNDGLLPAGYYARAEPTMRTMGPDVLTLESPPPPPGPVASGGLAATRVRFQAAAGPRPPSFRRRRVGIRHSSGDRLVAIIELVSPSNKASRTGIRAFVGKLVRAVDEGIHGLVIDPFPPTRLAPAGLHALIWEELAGDPIPLPADQPLTLAAYEVGDPTPKCYVEPLAVGQLLPDMPLFLKPGVSVDLPVEATYQTAWAVVIPRDRAVLEAP
jgi:hypothetical protein